MQVITTQEVTATNWLLHDVTWIYERISSVRELYATGTSYQTVWYQSKYREYIQESSGSRVGQQKFALNSSRDICKYK